MSRSRRDFLQAALAATSTTMGAAALGILCTPRDAHAEDIRGSKRLPAHAGKHTVIIDTDPGQNDVIAILFALGAKDQIDVKALTVVAGNVPLALTERNARIVRDWAGLTDTLPVYAGHAKPLMRELVTAEDYHGAEGLKGVTLHEPRAPLSPQHAVMYLIETLLNAAPGSITLVGLGPLTNFAAALIAAPDIAKAVREIVLMGGAFFERGNVTPTAEFNVYVDPEAAHIVFACGVPITVMPWDISLTAPITPARIAAFRALGNQCGMRVADIMTAEVEYRKTCCRTDSAGMDDPYTVAYLLAPSLFSGRHVNVSVETTGEHTLGETVVDWRGERKRPANAMWITDVDADGFYAAMLASIANLP